MGGDSGRRKDQELSVMTRQTEIDEMATSIPEVFPQTVWQSSLFLFFFVSISLLYTAFCVTKYTEQSVILFFRKAFPNHGSGMPGISSGVVYSLECPLPHPPSYSIFPFYNSSHHLTTWWCRYVRAWPLRWHIYSVWPQGCLAVRADSCFLSFRSILGMT